MPDLDTLSVDRHLYDAVGIVSHEVCCHNMGGDDFGFLLRGAHGAEYGVADLVQITVTEYGHV